MAKATKKDDVYAELPKSVMKDKELGLEKLPIVKNEYLTHFLKKTVPEKFHGDFTGDSDLKYQRLSLGGVKKQKPLTDLKRSRSKRKQLTAREKRDLKLFDIQKKEQNYEMYLPLHELWKDYMRDLLSLDKMTEAHHADTERKLLKADYSGALMTVTQAKCNSLIGKQGIVLMETKHTFKVVTKENAVKVFPKQNTIFMMELDGYAFTIYGNNFQFKPADRSTRKFKGSLSIAIK